MSSTSGSSGLARFCDEATPTRHMIARSVQDVLARVITFAIDGVSAPPGLG